MGGGSGKGEREEGKGTGKENEQGGRRWGEKRWKRGCEQGRGVEREIAKDGDEGRGRWVGARVGGRGREGTGIDCPFMTVLTVLSSTH